MSKFQCGRPLFSDRLPIEALVSRYLANKLIGRGPSPNGLFGLESRIRGPRKCHAVLARLSAGYPLWRVGCSDVLLTVRRAPISCIATENCALDLHALSTPPAFALSQDQTLV